LQDRLRYISFTQGVAALQNKPTFCVATSDSRGYCNFRVSGPINYWVTIEANLLIICASLPTVRQFLGAVAPGLISSIEDSDYSKRSGLVTIGAAVVVIKAQGGGVQTTLTL